MPITPHVQVGQACESCGQCCGGTCHQYSHCRGTCYPCCTDAVKFAANLDLPALYPVAKDEQGNYAAFDPNATGSLAEALGLTLHPVLTDGNGRLTNFRSVIVYVPGCGEHTGVLWTSGEFPEARIADGDANLVNALLSQPSFAKRVPNGYFRLI